MKVTFALLLFFAISVCSFSQSKSAYLASNRLDLNTSFTFPQTDFKLLGFGAIHGSSKTETAEIKLLESLLQNNDIRYYLMEVNYSHGYYFNEFLETGDTILLKELIHDYGYRVSQERSISVYEKWKALYRLNQSLPEAKRLTVIGLEAPYFYKYAIRQIAALTAGQYDNWETLNEIKAAAQLDTTIFYSYKELPIAEVIKRFVEESEEQSISWANEKDMQPLLAHLRLSFKDENREQQIFENYVALSKFYDFSTNKQFARYGFFHLEKYRERDSYPPFFARLIDNDIHAKTDVMTVMGYLTDSKVLWNIKKDRNYDYKGYSTKAGYGISDYLLEYFQGIHELKKAQISDLTLFRLNQPDSPYHESEPDLIAIKKIIGRSNRKDVAGKATTQFIDYALLISDSPANVPLAELKSD
ncbi:MAG: hypothetical protein AAGI23_13835 [Bacteroidota bacterium]